MQETQFKKGDKVKALRVDGYEHQLISGGIYEVVSYEPPSYDKNCYCAPAYLRVKGDEGETSAHASRFVMHEEK